MKAVMAFPFSARITGCLTYSAWSGAEYHILISLGEFESYRKRLYGLYAKGFDIKILRG